MDMTDEKLIEKLFRDASQWQVADNGFTERVMKSLPQRQSRVTALSRLWTLFCVTVAVVLFVLLRGWDIVAHGLFVLLTTPPSLDRLLMLFLSVATVGLLALGEFISRERHYSF